MARPSGVLVAAGAAAVVGAAVLVSRARAAPPPPVLDLGQDQTVELDQQGQAVLDLTYTTNVTGDKTWTLVSGPAPIQVEDTGPNQARLTLPIDGAYLVQLDIRTPSGLTVTARTTITVTRPAPLPTLESIMVEPPAPSVQAGLTLQLRAIGHFSNGTSREITNDAGVVWGSSALGIAVLDAPGLVRGVAQGTARITASVGAISGFADLTVTSTPVPPVLIRVDNNPVNLALAAGQSDQVQATAVFDDGSTLPVTNLAMWSSDNPAIAKVSATGLVTWAGQGTTTIRADYQGMVGQTNISAGAPPPGAPTIDVGPDLTVQQPAEGQPTTIDVFYTVVTSPPGNPFSLSIAVVGRQTDPGFLGSNDVAPGHIQVFLPAADIYDITFTVRDSVSFLTGQDSLVATVLAAQPPPPAGTFVEPFLWQGDLGAQLGGGVGNTVWLNAHHWDVRSDTANNSLSSGNGTSNGGEHVDIHAAAFPNNPRDATPQNDVLDLDGDGRPGVAAFHMDFEGITSARLRNPVRISAAQPGVWTFFANNALTTAHWWEIAITPFQPGRSIIGGENTAVPHPNPGPGESPFGSGGPGHTPPEDSINFVTMGLSDFLDVNIEGPGGWGIGTACTRAINGVVTQHRGPDIFVGVDPRIDDHENYLWRLELWPDRVELFVDLDEDGTPEHLGTMTVNIPWPEVYVALLGVAYQADHHPQGAAFMGQLRELHFRDMIIGPVKYVRTAAYPKEVGTDRLPLRTGWTGFDSRDNQRFGVVNGIPQPNPGPMQKDGSVAWASVPRFGVSSSQVFPVRTLTFDLPPADAVNIVHARMIYDIRYNGAATLSVNGTTVPGALLTQSSVPGHNEPTHWVQRSKDVDPSLFRPGLNTIVVSTTGECQFARVQFEFGYSA
jgi:hypothetical protein